MRASRIAFCLVAAVSLVAGSGCKKDDPMDEAKRLLREDPDKAIPLLRAQYEKDSSDYETIVGLAQAYKTKKSPSWERAAAWYRKALAHPRGQEKNVQAELRDELLVAIGKQIEAGRSSLEEKDLVALLKEANGLERDLGRNNIVAGKELFERAKAQFDGHVTAERYAEAIAEVRKLDELYVDQKAKQALVDQLPSLEGKKFRKDTLLAFETTFKPDLIEAGHYSADQAAFQFSAMGKVTLGVEGAPDPADENFAKNLEKATCGVTAALPRLREVLNPFAKAVLGRDLSEKELVKYHNFANRKRKTRWEGEAWDPTKTYEEGAELTFVCEDSLSLEIVIGGFLVMRQKAAVEKK